MSKPKRLYHFTGPDFALDNVEKRHLKISFYDEVNDVFEMMPFDFGEDRAFRSEWRKRILRTSKEAGSISFSRTWDVPTMWGHYAQNHKGVCYGFDVSCEVTKIDYEENFRKIDPKARSCKKARSAEIQYAQRTKSKHWKYEKEHRVFVTLSEEEKIQKSLGKPLFFVNFQEELRLREVIIGANSELESNKFESALSDYDGVEVKTARASFRNFKIVEQKSDKLAK